MKIQGVSIHVEQHGKGKPAIIFLHYWGGTSRTWRLVSANLQDKFQTIAYDARGWGRSDKVSAGYTLGDLADELLGLVRELNLNSFVLVGHSLGGKVAQLAASRRPEGLLGLVLVAPAPPTPLRLPADMRETQIHAYDNRETVLQTIRFLTARMPSPEMVDQIVEDSMSGSREATLAYPTSSILEDISSEVPKIAVPTLVLAGELDRLDSIEQHNREVVARIPNARLGIIPRSGHLIPIDEPEELAKRIEQFVSDLDPIRYRSTLIERAYSAFNRRDIEGALALMTENVSWPRASEGGTVVGKQAIRAYWIRQWSEFDPHVEPVEMVEEAGRMIRVKVHQQVKSLEGEILSDSDVLHVFTLNDGLIAAMDLGDSSDADTGPSIAFMHRS